MVGGLGSWGGQNGVLGSFLQREPEQNVFDIVGIPSSGPIDKKKLGVWGVIEDWVNSPVGYFQTNRPAKLCGAVPHLSWAQNLG